MRRNQFLMGILFMLGILIIAGCNNNNTTGNVAKEIETNTFTGDVKEFKVEAFQFGFEPSVIKVNLGDQVRIIASSRDVPHSFTLPDFGVNLYVDGLKSQTAEFVADKKGTFTFYCAIPCGAGHSRMKGKFIVT